MRSALPEFHAVAIATSRAAILLLSMTSMVELSLSYSMREVFMDPATQRACQSQELERVERGVSGVIFSHKPYGAPYLTDKNCLLVLQAPLDYRIELRVLEFDVEGTPDAKGNCDGDSLYVFDHEETVTENARITAPGPIIGQFCGRRRNNSQPLAISSRNVLTLWWHTSKQQQSDAAQQSSRAFGKSTFFGFKILWTAIREPGTGFGCAFETEFQCKSGNVCIPLALVCDNVAHCPDGTDVDRRHQREQGCRDVTPEEMFGALGLATVAGICISSVLGLLFCIILLVCCCYCCRRRPTPSSSRYTPA